MMRMAHFLGCASYLGAGLLGNTAFVGEAVAQDTQAGAAGEASITDIIVTAQRQEQLLQKTSLSISVLDREVLKNVNDAKDIAALVPGVQISNGGSTVQTYVRGVGDFGSSALNQSAVSFNLDGVYVADTAAVANQFYDLARVEVLKGPQGTLYGRNASAGAVNLVYAHPDLTASSATGSFEVGNYGLLHGSVAANAAISEQFGIRLSLNALDRDGYLSDGTSDDDQMAGRLQLLYEPSEAFSLRIVGDLAYREGRGPGSVLLPRQPGNGKFTGAIDLENNNALLAGASPPFTFLVYTPGSGLPPSGFNVTGLQEDTFIDHSQENIAAELNWDLNFARLTYIPAYRHSKSSIGSYLTGAPFLNQEETDQQSHELRLARQDHWGSLVVGVYYLDLDQYTAAQVYNNPFVIADQSAELGTESIAGFGQLTINATDALRFIGGLRYTNEDRRITASDLTNSVDFSSSVTFKKWTWRGGIEYDLTPSNMAYVSISKGFKSGGFNVFAPAPGFPNTYEPETLYSYAAGLKNRFLDNKVQFNVEGFYWDYRNSQQNALAFTPQGNLQFSTFNAASATLYGFDADMVVKPTRADTLSAALSYLHSKFDTFVIQTPFPSNAAANGCALNNSAPPFTIDCSGMRLPRAPKWSGNVSYSHEFAIGASDTLTVGASMDFATSRSLGINYISNEQVGGFVRFNADAEYRFGDGRFAIAGFIRNIGDREIPIAGNQAGFSPGLVYAQVAPPRTYGMRLSASY